MVAVFAAHANVGPGLGHDLFGSQAEAAEFVGTPARSPARQHRFGRLGMKLSSECPAGHNGLRDMRRAFASAEFWRVRLGIGHPGHKDRVHGYVLGNFAKAEIDPLTDMLAAISAEAPWLADGDDARFMSDVALRMQD